MVDPSGFEPFIVGFRRVVGSVAGCVTFYRSLMKSTCGIDVLIFGIIDAILNCFPNELRKNPAALSAHRFLGFAPHFLRPFKIELDPFKLAFCRFGQDLNSTSPTAMFQFSKNLMIKTDVEKT